MVTYTPYIDFLILVPCVPIDKLGGVLIITRSQEEDNGSLYLTRHCVRLTPAATPNDPTNTTSC